jgi:transcriptional regulator with XRE-family HTH domain
MDVLWLKSQGLPHKEICRLTGISGTTLRKYLRMFQSGGVEKLMEMSFALQQASWSSIDISSKPISVSIRQRPSTRHRQRSRSSPA